MFVLLLGEVFFFMFLSSFCYLCLLVVLFIVFAHVCCVCFQRLVASHLLLWFVLCFLLHYLFSLVFVSCNTLARALALSVLQSA